MGDWDFLHEMQQRGYSQQDIADAASCGAAPWDIQYIDEEWLATELDDESEEGMDEPHSLEPFRSRNGYPHSFVKQAQIFDDLVDCAQRHFENTGRYLQVWGELGEIYAELQFGLRRHGSHHAGSDGEISGKRVEVKTISPEKSSNRVLIKSQGDFEQLLIIRIDHKFQFRCRLFDRCELRWASRKFLCAHFIG